MITLNSKTPHLCHPELVSEPAPDLIGGSTTVGGSRINRQLTVRDDRLGF